MQYPTWKENGRIKLMIIVGTRPEIIRLSAVIKKCRKYFDTILAHTGQNYDYNLNGIFFKDLGLDDPELYLKVSKAISADIRENVLQYLMVRRTRNSINKYYQKDKSQR